MWKMVKWQEFKAQDFQVPAPQDLVYLGEGYFGLSKKILWDYLSILSCFPKVILNLQLENAATRWSGGNLVQISFAWCDREVMGPMILISISFHFSFRNRP